MDDWMPEPQERGSLEPPRRNPPTAVGVATPPPPDGPRRSRYRETRMQRIGRAFALTAVSVGLGLAAGTLVPMPVLLSSFAFLAGGRMILQRQHSRFSERLLYLGSSRLRRAA